MFRIEGILSSRDQWLNVTSKARIGDRLPHVTFICIEKVHGQ